MPLAEAGGALGWKKKEAEVLEDKPEPVLRVLNAAQALCEALTHAFQRGRARLKRARGLAQSHPGRKG